MNNIYVFDFDGVVASSKEDDIYKLDSFDGEDAFLQHAANVFNINCNDRNLNYRRHMVFQTAAHVNCLPIDKGSHFQTCLEVTNERMFILTARSSWHGVGRVRSFMEDHDIFPVEMFSVGNCTKNPQLLALCRDYPNDLITYFEDSDGHVEAARGLNHDQIHVVHVPKESGRVPSDALREFYIDQVRMALR